MRCSFNDKVLDDKSNKDGDDGENHEEQESTLLVCQAPSSAAGLCAGPGPRWRAADRHVAPLRRQSHRGAVGAAQLGSILTLSDGTHPETVVAVGLQVVDMEGRVGAFVRLRGAEEDRERL